MPITPDQKARLVALAEKTKAHQIEGVFSAEPGQGLSPQDLALKLWELGYIPVPTVEALVEAMEKEVARVINKKTNT